MPVLGSLNFSCFCPNLVIFSILVLFRISLLLLTFSLISSWPASGPNELKTKANEFLQLAVRFILDQLDSPNVNHLAQVLHRIYLNHPDHCPFYTRQSNEKVSETLLQQFLPAGTGVSVGTSPNEVDTTNMTAEQMSTMWRTGLSNWTRYNRGERNTSPLYFININYLGVNGGFITIFDYLQNEKNLSLWTLKLLTKVVCVMRWSLSLKFLKLFLPSFVDVVCTRLLNWFGVNLKVDQRAHYEDTIGFLVTLMKELMSDDAANQRIDAYTLEGCLAMFKTENLEKRLRGLRDLKSLVDRTQKEERRFGANIGKFFAGQAAEDEDDKKKKKLPRIAPKMLMSWLQENSFLDLFFQMLKSHIEILRQGTPILIFVAQQGGLKLEHTDAIWSMAANMHEHDKRILNSSLVALVPHLPPAHLDHLIAQISQSPLRLMDEQSVELIVSLTSLSIAANTKHKWNGLELLWNICQDPSDANIASAAKAKDGTKKPKDSNANSAGSSSSAAAAGGADGAISAATANSNANGSPSQKRKDAGGNGKEKDSSTVTTIDPLLAHKAFTKLCDLLTTEECAPQRPTYMERSFTNIDERRSVSLSIEVLRRCIDAYPVRRRKKAVTDLESKKKLLTLIFDDMQYYHTEAKRVEELQMVLRRSAAEYNAPSNAAASAPAEKKNKKRKKSSNVVEDASAAEGEAVAAPSAQASSVSRPDTPSNAQTSNATNPSAFNVNQMVVLGRAHIENVTQRLNFLEYVIQNAALVMRLEQVDSIWDLFISQALSAEEREVAFGWLERASNAPTSSDAGSAVVLSEQQLQHLFTNKMLTTSGNAFTSAGYQLFERYFDRINDRLGKVKFADERNGKAIGLLSSDATGLDKLWEIALQNEDKAVSTAAIAHLNQLHLNLELFMNRTKAAKIRETYVQTALMKLTSAALQYDARAEMERCLRLLSECVLDFEEIKGESAVSAASASGSSSNASLLSGWTFGDMFGGGGGAGNGKRKGAGLATTVKIFLKSPSKSPQRLVLNSQTTIRSLSEKAIELFNFDIYDTLKLTLENEKDRELSKDPEKTLGELKVPDDATIVVRKGIDAIEGNGNDSIYVFSSLLQGLMLGVGGVGSQTSKISQIIARAENTLKASIGAGASSNAVAAMTAKNGKSAHASSNSSSNNSSAMNLQPMFPPLQRSSLYREIRLDLHVPTAVDLKTHDLHPARIICTTDNFNKLYGLLGNAEGELGERLWELLSVLPPVEATKRELASISASDHVRTVFPRDKPFQLLYALQLLEPMLATAIDNTRLKNNASNASSSAPSSPRSKDSQSSVPPSPKASSSQNAQNQGAFAHLDIVWIDSLLKAGLLEHLLDAFYAIKISSSMRESIGTMKLLPQLLRVINMLSLSIKEEKNVPSHIASLNLSRSFSHSLAHNPNQGKYELTTRREHFRTSANDEHQNIDAFAKSLVERVIKLTMLLSSSSSSSNKEDDSQASKENADEQQKNGPENVSALSTITKPKVPLSRQQQLEDLAMQDSMMEDEALIVQEALVLLIPVVAASRTALDHLLKHSKFLTWLIKLILQSPSVRVRESAVRAVSELVASTPAISNKTASAAKASSALASQSSEKTSNEDEKNSPPESATQLSLLLLELLLPGALAEDSSLLDTYAICCDELFLTLEILLRDVASTQYFAPDEKQKKEKSKGDNTKMKSRSGTSSAKPIAHPVLLDLVKQLISKIKSRPVVERFAVDGQEDKILIGMMQLVYSIVHRDGAAVAGQKSRSALYKPACRSLVKELFHNCLFTIPTLNSRGPDAPPKCKTKSSRAIGYRLLTELCSNCDKNLQAVLNLLQQQVHMIDMREDYNFYSGRNEKSPTGYVGLQNQGATCYMNATMQQLFMVNEFRQGVLSIHDPSFDKPLESVLLLPPEKKKKPFGMSAPKRGLIRSALEDTSTDSDDSSSSEAAINWTPETAMARLEKESILYQLQRMFAHLQEGERKSFETRPFCYAYKDFEGNPINTSQQMDANEYYNRLFDSIESRLKGTAQEDLLKQIFGGRYANQLLGTGEECSHRRESTEPFFSISVDIKHKTTLQESLKAFTEGEILGGDNKPQCPRCNKNVDTLKRCLMHTLPPILVIHLKRFEFHYEQMRHFKLNSSCSFPMELDMEPYMRESHAAKESAKSKAAAASSGSKEEGENGEKNDVNGENNSSAANADEDSLSDLINLAQARQAAGYYDYELEGVVVHVGSSDAGHYYSFIKERPHSLPPGRVRDATVGTKWYEFNDSYVTEFDPAKIPVECFGGEDEVMEWADEARTTKRAVKRPRTNNAYILIYQRKNLQQKEQELQLQLQAQQQLQQQAQNTHNNGDNNGENASSSPGAQSQLQVDPSAASSSSNNNIEQEDLVGSSITSSSQQQNAKEDVEVEHDLDSARDGDSSVQKKSTEEEEDLKEESSSEKEGKSEKEASKKEKKLVDSETEPSEQDKAQVSSEDNKSEHSEKEKADERTAEVGSSAEKSSVENAVVKEEPVVKPRGAVEIFSTIYDENREFLIRKYLFDQEYFAFVWSIVNANLPPSPPRTPDEIRSAREETQRKVDQQRMMRERQELERETNAFPSPFVPRLGVPGPNMPPPPGPRQIVVGAGASAIKLEVRAMNHTNASLKQEESRIAKERKEEEARRAKEKPLDADEQRLEQERKMDAADKAATSKSNKKDSKSSKSKEDVKEPKETKDSKDSKDSKASSPSAPATPSKSTEKTSTKTKTSSNTSVTASSASVSKEDEVEEIDASSSSGVGANADLTTFALDFIKNIYVHARETPLLTLWLNTLYRLFSANVGQAKHLLRTMIKDPADLVDTLLHSHSEKARTCYAQMVVAAMRALRQSECTRYLSTARQIHKAAIEKREFVVEPESYCVWFLEEMWKMLRLARKNHFDAYFYIFAQFANFGNQERTYLLKRGFLAELVSFALYFEPAAVNSPARLSTPRQAARELPNLADLIATLLLACDAETPEPEGTESSSPSLQPPTSLNPLKPHELSDQEHGASLSALFGGLLMREDVNSHAVGKIYCHFMFEHPDMTKFVMGHIIKSISQTFVPSQTRGFMDVLAYIVRNLDDSLKGMRFDLIITNFPKWIAKYKQTRRAGVERIIQSFFIMASLDPLFRQKVMQKKSQLNGELESAGYRIL